MKNYNELSTETKAVFDNIVISTIKDRFDPMDRIEDLSDLHHKAFNEDYFIIGYYEAEKFLNENGGVFNAIGVIKEYEQDQFGELTTDISSSEKVANMFAYIIGEELIYNLESDETAKNLIKSFDA